MRVESGDFVRKTPFWQVLGQSTEAFIYYDSYTINRGGEHGKETTLQVECYIGSTKGFE